MDDNNKTEFMHLDLDEGKVTFAFKVRGNLTHVGAAWCSPTDQFNRKLGRAIAEGRLDADKCLWKLETAGCTTRAQIKARIREALKTAIEWTKCGAEYRLPWWLVRSPTPYHEMKKTA